MLENVEDTEQSTIARWLGHGRAFKIFDKKRFVKELLPLYFQQQGKFASFQRQLNLYNFRRLNGQRNEQQKAYYHCLFLRGRPDLATLMPRNRLSSHSARKTYDPESEPDFESLRPLPVPPKRPTRAIGPGPHRNATLTLGAVLSHQPLQLPIDVLSSIHVPTMTFNTATMSTNMRESGNPPTSLRAGAHFQPSQVYSAPQQLNQLAPSTLPVTAPAAPPTQPLCMDSRLPSSSYVDTRFMSMPSEAPRATNNAVMFPNPTPVQPSPLRPIVHFTEPASTYSTGCWTVSNIVSQTNSGEQQQPQQLPSSHPFHNATNGNAMDGLQSDSDVFHAMSTYQNQLNQMSFQSTGTHPTAQYCQAPTPAPPMENTFSDLHEAAANATQAAQPARETVGTSEGRARLSTATRQTSQTDSDGSSSLDMSQASGKVLAEWLEEVDFYAKG
jgi:HSF-type DNA-binding